MSEWKECKLNDLVTKLGDGLHGTPKYDPKGDYYFINGSNLIDGKISVNENTKRVSKDEFDKYKKELSDRTIFVSINGTLGNIAIYNNEKIILGKSACYFNVKDGVCKEFIKYIVTDKAFQHYISEYATGSTIKNVPLKAIRDFTLKLPDFLTQTAIAEILSSLDDKIELNNKINQELESLAQLLFKRWFVDFEFPNENGDPYKSSGCEMEDSQLGEIPKGWEVHKLGKFISFLKGKKPKEVFEKQSENTLPQILIETLDTGNSLYANQEKMTICKKDDILMVMDGGSSGRIETGFEGIVGSTLAIIVNKEIEKAYLYRFLKSKELDIRNNTTGAAIPHTDKAKINDYDILLPQKIVLEEFSKISNDLNELIFINSKEIFLLKSLRDTLLSKLISGELQINDN